MYDCELYCPICGSDDFRVEENDETPWHDISLVMSCRRCETLFTAVYALHRIHDVEITQPYGPAYVTRDAQAALLAWEADGGETGWSHLRTNGAAFVVGYAPWLALTGYGRKDGWQALEADELSAILAHT